MKQKQKYEIRGMRIYDKKTYIEFQHLCRLANSNVSRVLNGVISDIVRAGTINPQAGARDGQ